MNKFFRNAIVILVLISSFFISCQSDLNNSKSTEKPIDIQEENVFNPEEEELIALVEKL